MNHTVPTRVFKLSPITHGHVVRTLWVHPPTSALLPISQGLCLLQLLFHCCSSLCCCYHGDCRSYHQCSCLLKLASFPAPHHIHVLIACSMQTQREKVWERGYQKWVVRVIRNGYQNDSTSEVKYELRPCIPFNLQLRTITSQEEHKDIHDGGISRSVAHLSSSINN